MNTELSKEKVRLRELEKEGKWVFHGSGSKIEILEPRQAHNYPKNSEEAKIPDDEPAVFATPFADTAIFMAIYCKPNVENCRSGFTNHSDGRIDYRVTPQSAAQIQGAKGYVYVFPKDKFPNSRGASEVLSYEEARPTEVVLVTEKDLPENIVVKDF
jgi:hypothetical protein